MQTIDYNALWQQGRAATRACRGGAGNQYDSPAQARQYDSSRSIREDGQRRADALPVTAGQTVLDIGAGPGTLALPLARRGVMVTAVEPSAAMASLLRQHAAEEGLGGRIRILEARWEEVAPSAVAQHDLVVASYSLNMEDLRSALLAMNATARQWVYLYWFAGVASWERLLCDLYPAIHGREYLPQPKCDLIYNILYQLGLYPEVRLLEGTAFPHFYPDAPAALSNLRGRLGLTDSRWDGLLEEYLRAHFRPEGAGWRFVDETRYVQLRWRPAEVAL